MDAMTADDVATKHISELEAKRYQAMTDADIDTLEELHAAMKHAVTRADMNEQLALIPRDPAAAGMAEDKRTTSPRRVIERTGT